MTLTEFMSILNGEYKETAGTSAKNQCVDLVNAYIKYVLGLPIIEYTNAKDFPSKAGDKYEYILNTPTGVPQEGDIVVWDGTYGHVAIFIEGNANRFTSFDENFPTGTPCHVQEHNYTNVLGWLRYKGGAPVYQVGVEVIQNSDNWIGFLQKFNYPNNKDVVYTTEEQHLTYEQKLIEKDSELNKYREEVQKTITTIEGQVKTLSEENTGLKTDLATLQTKYNDDIQNLNNKVEEGKIKIIKLETDIQNLKSIKPLTGYSRWELIKALFWN